MTLAICLLTLPLSACDIVPPELAQFVSFILGSRHTTAVAVECPKLSAPPVAAIDALDAARKEHPEVGKWEVDLEKHLEKLDKC